MLIKDPNRPARTIAISPGEFNTEVADWMPYSRYADASFARILQRAIIVERMSSKERQLMIENDFLTLVKDILEIEDEELSTETVLSDVGWDSLSSISFIAAVDEQTGKTVSPSALKECATVADLYALI